jgi:lipoprotein-anchoring transpeptidase ErfK/SrfK
VRVTRRFRSAPLLLGAAFAAFGCKPKASGEGAASSASGAPASAEVNPVSSVVVDHGELDTRAPKDSPMIAATVIATTVYKLPNVDSRRLGYIRLGGQLRRDAEPVSGKGCKGSWYRVYPMGYVCTDEATTKLDDPLVRAASVRPDLDQPMPYHYGFVRATAPQYLRIPSKAEQLKSEFKLEEHLDWYVEHKDEVQSVILGANDVPLDSRGVALPGLEPAKGFVPSTKLSLNQLFGGKTAHDPVPFWLKDGKRSIPNVSGFEVPEYAVFADRVRRKTGLSFVGAFDTESEGMKRGFAVTVDMRLIPTTKVKPDTGSPFHGVELKGIEMPFAWVTKSDVTTWKLIRGRDEAKPADAVPKRVIVPISGKARIKDKKRFYQTAKDKTRWLRADDIAIVAPPAEWPEWAEKGEKWVDISLREQTLVLYEGKKPWYATLVSTGRDGMQDPKTTLSTPMGKFRLQSKHIAAAMDSDENSAVAGGTRSRKVAYSGDTNATIERLKQAEKDGEKLNDEDQRRLVNIQKGRHPEYGITMRRGSANFELRDVPYIQYFAAGYALHGAYWHDVFGIPRSHGCVNLAPIDARLVFRWTDPPVPDGWHGINVGPDMGEGTAIYIHE